MNRRDWTNWPTMPKFADEGYDRSEWLLETDPGQLAIEHRELLDYVIESHNAAIRRNFEEMGYLFS